MLTLDFDANKSVVLAGPRVQFKPVVKLLVRKEDRRTAKTEKPMETPEPTATSPPTDTPVPAATSPPTDTPVPTATSPPTATPTPEPTPDALGDVFFLEITSPQPDEGEDIAFVTSASVVVAGRTRVDATVTVNDEFPVIGDDGDFQTTVQLVLGPNLIEVVSSIGTGEELSEILVVAYEPPEQQ